MLFLVSSQVMSQNLNTKSIESIEILSKSSIDSSVIIIDSQKSVEIEENKTARLSNEEVLLIKEYISTIFIYKKANVFEKIEKIEGFRYSSKQTLNITVKFNENEQDIYIVNLSLPDYKVYYSDEFKKFLRVLYKLRK